MRPIDKIHYNSIPVQQLTHNNELTIKNWNSYINQLRIQTNDITTYIKQLVKWLDDSGTNNYQTKLSSANAGTGIIITEENGIIKINSQVTNVLVDEMSIFKNSEHSLSLYGYSSAPNGTVPYKTALGLSWITIPSLDRIEQLMTDIGTVVQTVHDYADDTLTYSHDALLASQNAQAYASQAEVTYNQLISYLGKRLWYGTLAEYNALETIEPGCAYFIHG